VTAPQPVTVTLPYGGPATWGAPLDTAELAKRIAACNAATRSAKSKPFEELLVWLLPYLPGFTATNVNMYNFGRAYETDVVLWNDQVPGGFPSFGDSLIVECKNWDSRVTSSDVAWFDWKLRLGGAREGILVAAKGVTGNPERVLRPGQSSRWQRWTGAASWSSRLMS
jgi:hypothetical protein